MASTSNLSWPDYLVIVAYFGFVLATGIISAKRSKKDSMSGYFLASRSMHWIPVGASIFASNIGSGHFIGLASSGAASGIGIGAFEFNAIFAIMALGWWFVPVYMSSGIFTMPEYMRERFGGQRIRIYLSGLSLILYVFTKISADLYAGALFIQQAVGQTSQEWLYISVIILLAIAALFTITGGLTAVIWTDFVQTILMIAGSVILMTMSITAVGGYSGLFEKYPYAIASNVSEQYKECAIPPSDSLHLIRSAIPGESDLPWPGVIFGLTITSMWYWCADQVIVQRALASKTITHAKAGCCLASFLKLLSMFLLVFPGMAARILYTEEVACVEPEKCEEICGSSNGCTNIAYVKLVLGLLPTGLRGLMLAVMMAALMSSLTSIFNSSSTIFTIDVWSRIRRKSWKNMSPRSIELENLVVGRLFVIFLVAISVIWIPVIENFPSSELFVYIQSITSFLAPPIVSVFLLAMFWKRTNEPGAFWGLMIGLVIGMIRFGLQYGFTTPGCGSVEGDTRPEIIKIIIGQIHYLHFRCILVVISFIITIVVSLLTEPIPEKCLHRLTYSTRFSTEKRVSVREWRNEMHEDKFIEKITNGLIAPEITQESQGCSFLYKICGMSKDSEKPAESIEIVKTPEETAKEAAEFLHEDPAITKYMNVTSLALMSLTVFIWAFYA